MIGRFRHRIVLMGAPATVQGDGGTLSNAQDVIGGAWAKLEPLSGREDFDAQRFNYPVSHRIRVRYLPARMAARSAVFGDRTFRIQSARDVGERHTLIDYLAEEETS